MKTFTLLQLADALTTWFGIRYCGAHEANPFVAKLVTHDPILGLVIVKLVAFALFAIAWYKAARVLSKVNRFYMALVLWNVVCIGIQVIR